VPSWKSAARSSWAPDPGAAIAPARQVASPRGRSGGALRRLGLPAATLALGGLAGAAANLVGVPLAWMLGPLLVIGTASGAGLPLAFPTWGRWFGQVVIGGAIGLYFTPPVAALVAELLPVMVIAAVLLILASAAIAFLIERLGHVDRATAYFASVPGGVAEMAILSQSFGGQVAPVALAQSLRILLVVAIVPIVVSLSGAHGESVFRPVDLAFEPLRLVLLLLLATGAGYGLFRLRLPNAFMLGAMAVSVITAMFELPLSSIPSPVVSFGQVLLGTTLGLGFRRDQIRMLWRFVPLAVAGTVLLLVVATLFAFLIGGLADIDIATMVLSLAPGGITEMGITAKILGLGVPLVSAFHVVRIILVVTTTPLLFRLLRWLR
jgi:uncharacterized protein